MQSKYSLQVIYFLKSNEMNAFLVVLVPTLQLETFYKIQQYIKYYSEIDFGPIFAQYSQVGK